MGVSLAVRFRMYAPILRAHVSSAETEGGRTLDGLVEEDHVGGLVPGVLVVRGVLALVRDRTRAQLKEETGRTGAAGSTVEPVERDTLLVPALMRCDVKTTNQSTSGSLEGLPRDSKAQKNLDEQYQLWRRSSPAPVRADPQMGLGINVEVARVRLDGSVTQLGLLHAVARGGDRQLVPS